MKIKHLNINILFFLLLILSLPLSIRAHNIPKNYFRSPVDFKITLSGTFAELRNNHFHSGIDIRTFTTGKKVYAIADGIVSRIKISEGGYGKALYIDHPNGYTSVYAHLNKFSPKIEAFIKSQQYKNKKFEVDIDLSKMESHKKELFKFKKSNVIAYSGNTGSSMGPHLHFEIRETKSEKPINPLLLDFKILDTTAPMIYSLYVYSLDKNSSVNGQNVRQAFKLSTLNKNNFILKTNKMILHGKIGFAIYTEDLLDNTWGKCGINKLQLKINDSLVTNYSLNKFSFDESSYINSHIDYELNHEIKRKVHKAFIEPNNKLSFYSEMKTDGSYNFNENKNYSIEFSVFDSYQNRAKLQFTAKGDTTSVSFPEKTFTRLFKYEDENKFSEAGIDLKFPKDCFYSNLEFDYSTSTDSSFLSAIYHIHQQNVALNKHFSLSIKLDEIDQDLSDKLVVVQIDKDGKLSSEGGVYINGYIKTKTKNLGNYAVSIDTLAPSITTKTDYKNKNIKNLKFIDFTIKDNLSGIKSYHGEIDNKWVLFEFDKKENRLFYTFDKSRLPSNKKHQLKLIVTDAVGNIGQYSCEFTW
ncbi:M23 family peptidase [Ancylomarina euxinus]|uniref:M23 family peptidase n=1 Tax=Ancylomarina euxinus TaxID=2283627 RepID=A0A425XWS2_9BACT|nr:M23 family metallopeptidase [Ancylomarina euxinus]MCZ4696328.1 M23 family metallopeptidase [Ancylomarina euxinus]MUP16707.1 peptidoglycan DD-metalloendopeptidase family protein [Ancylomarina euxinus]RRG19091.1 M23 family peptidase [Ancylomarina euxinus]